MPKKPTIITNPSKSWWAGDERVEKFLPPVIEAIKRHIKQPSAEFTDIYNRAYEAVYQAIKEYDEAFERGKEIGIAMASAPCLFCGKKTNECKCGHDEIAKRLYRDWEKYRNKWLRDNDNIAFLDFPDWLDKEAE